MKFGLVASNIYPLLTSSFRTEKIGGAELQQINIAKSMTARGHEVRIVCLDHGQNEGEAVGDVIVHKTFREDAGIPVVRWAYPRLTSLWAALKRADCDLYYCRAAGFTPGILRLFRRATGKKYVYAGALDTDFMPGLASIPTVRDRLLYEYGLRGADGIIVQSLRQKTLLMENYGLAGVLAHNFLLQPRKSLPVEDRQLVLWVSTIRNRKRPLLFARLAERFPQQRFVMVGGKLDSHSALYDEVVAESRCIPNLEFLGFQPYENVEALFDQCRVFVNTSLYEGFPNTYLQAWRRNIPVLSFLDPDAAIQKNALGRVVNDEEELASALAEILDSFSEYDHAGEYYSTHHSSEVGSRLTEFFEHIVTESTSGRKM